MQINRVFKMEGTERQLKQEHIVCEKTNHSVVVCKALHVLQCSTFLQHCAHGLDFKELSYRLHAIRSLSYEVCTYGSVL